LWRYGLLDADSVVMQAVESGWTNHNFLVRLDKEEIFARVIGTETEILGINRDAEMLASGAAAAAGIAPQVLAYFPKEDVILYECIRGRALPKRYASNPRILQRVGLLFQQCHTMDVSLPLTVDPFERIQQYRDAMQHRGLALPSNERAAFQALAKIRSALAKDTDCAPCHLDVHTGNILYDGHQLWLVDWEYAAMSSPLFDLALYASTHNLSVEEQKNLLYFYSKQDDAKSISRLALYRMVADLYWACWGYLEDGVSELDQPYGAFARKCWDRYIQSAQHSSFLKHLLVADE
jgi:thiamine kinase-like enzyme